MKTSLIQQNGVFPIRTVSGITGVHPGTLRAWERRYQLVQPSRTPKGHRLYTEHDIKRIRQILACLEDGMSISQIKSLLDPGSTSLPLFSDTPDAIKPQDPWPSYVEHMLDAVRAFDAGTLDAIYNDALSLYPISLVSRRLSTPVLKTLGECWRKEPSGIAQEHFFSCFLRNRLGARFLHINSETQGPRVLIACPAGELHELGMILFALVAADNGYRVVLLGANVPAGQIVSAAGTSNVAAVILSVSTSLKIKALKQYLSVVTKVLSTPILVGGEGSVSSETMIHETGAIAVGTDFNTGLVSLNEQLTNPR